MSSGGTDALEQAIALYRAPGRLPLLLERPLPGAVLLLLRIAADDRAAIATAVEATGETAETLNDAALLYIQQVLFADTADAYRLLGVAPNAADTQIKEHYRWLMRWLHPDRQPERWEVVYSDRVNGAWQELRSPERRAGYRPPIRSDVVVTAELPVRPLHRAVPNSPPAPLLSPELTQRLPHIVLGGLALAALTTLGLLYYAQREDDTNWDAEMAPVAATLPQANGETGAVKLSIPSSSAVAETLRLDLPNRQPISIPVAVAAAPIKPATARLAAMSSTTATVSVQAAKTGRPPELAPRESPRLAAVAAPERKLRSPAVHKDPDTADPMLSAASSDPPVHAASVQAREASISVPRSFAAAYAAGDLVQMMRLFSSDATDNRGGIDAIAEDYDHLFRSTLSRELELGRLEWTLADDRIVGQGPFEARIRHRDDPVAKPVHGWLQIEAVPIAGRWRIARILHRTTP